MAGKPPSTRPRTRRRAGPAAPKGGSGWAARKGPRAARPAREGPTTPPEAGEPRTLVVAEKPSVARDIARALGARGQGRGFYYSDRHVVTWCVGHLVELEEPGAYDPAWKRWTAATLPMLPGRFKLRPAAHARDQWRVVRDLLRSRGVRAVVNACDAGREGELIFRYCYELAGSRLPAQRLWVSSMTDEALRAGLARLRPGSHYDALADAARCRSEADWLVGMNATRALTLRARRVAPAPPTAGRTKAPTLYSVGRVQTPTLALLVAREQAIRTFVPRPYWEVTGNFARANGDRFAAGWAHDGRSRLGHAGLADAIVARAKARASTPLGPRVESVEKKPAREAPPLLFDLTSLQRTANRRFGFSARHALDVAQSLYEKHKLITYPRTDSRHLPRDFAGELPGIFRALASEPALAPFASRLLASPPGPRPRVFDDRRISDHHAVVPTDKAPRPGQLDRDEARLYDLIARRFLGAFFPDAEFAVTTITVAVGPAAGTTVPRERGGPAADTAAHRERGDRDAFVEGLPPEPDRFVARGRVRTVAGWQEVAGMSGETKGEAALLPDVAVGERLRGAYESAAKQTQPPPRFTEASLLGAMETAGNEIDDEALRLAMKDRGLGTPATRAAVIETLLQRGYVRREQKLVVPTPLGESLLALLPIASLSSPALTGDWEARLARMARGEEPRDAFMRDIEAYVGQAVREICQGAPPALGSFPPALEGSPPAFGMSPPGFVTSPPRSDTRPPGFTVPAPASVRLPPSPPKAPKPPLSLPAKPPTPAEPLPPCPKCRQGAIIQGKRAWGCGRWREGCGLVIPFEYGGKALTQAQLRDLLARGKTRPAVWPAGGGAPTKGRLCLDLSATPPALRFEPA
jgi:DNA topoisomerase III